MCQENNQASVQPVIDSIYGQGEEMVSAEKISIKGAPVFNLEVIVKFSV